MTRSTHLTRLLDAHTPADDVEAAFVDRFRSLLALPGDVFGRDHFAPGHVTASAFVLSPEGRDLLLILHGKLHIWVQPGGHVDPDDVDVIAAARREVAEEVGFDDLQLVQDGLFDVDIHDIPARKGDPDHAHYDVRILLRAPHRDARAGSDAKDARWVPLADVEGLDTDESVLRAVRKIRALSHPE